MDNKLPITKIYLSDNSWLVIQPNFWNISPDEFNYLWELSQDLDDVYIKMFGKLVKVPRKTTLFSNHPEVSYKFSGTIVKSLPITPDSIIGKILQYFNDNISNIEPSISINLDKKGQYFNGVFGNWYKDGKEYINQHSDDEKDLNSNMGIWSISFGGVRKFVLTDKKTGKKVKEIDLEDGMLLGMCGDFQKEFKHGIPKQKIAKPRINLTIRAFN